MMSQLPLNDRNYLQLALLSPGTGTYGKSSFYNSALTDNAGSVISGSAGEDRNAFSLDGADIKSYLINGSFVPSIEAVEEFKIETTPYSAELGTSPGAQILLITKNGTNQLHGSAYEFLRNDFFDAKNYFDNPTSLFRNYARISLAQRSRGRLSGTSFSILEITKAIYKGSARLFLGQFLQCFSGKETSRKSGRMFIIRLRRLPVVPVRADSVASSSRTIPFPRT